MTYTGPTPTIDTADVTNTRTSAFGVHSYDTPVTPTQARRDFFPWEVETTPLLNGRTFDEVADYKATIRNDDNSVLGVVGKGYGVITNDEFVELAEATGLMVRSAGTAYGGGRVWMQLDIGGDDFLPGVEPHQKYVWFASSHDGSGSLVVRPTMVRVACMNQWFSLRRNHKVGGEITLRHTRFVSDRIAAARSAITMAYDNFAAMEADIERMLGSHELTLGRMVDEIFGERPTEEGRKRTTWDNRFEAISTIYHSDTCDAIRDTDYGLVMAVNEWELNRSVKPGQEEKVQRRVMNGLTYTERASELVLARV